MYVYIYRCVFKYPTVELNTCWHKVCQILYLLHKVGTSMFPTVSKYLPMMVCCHAQTGHICVHVHLKPKPRGGIGNGTGEGLLFLPIGSDQAGSCIASKVDAKNSCAAVGLWVPDPSRKRETLSGYPSQFKLLTSFYWFQSKSETSEIFRAGIHSTDMESGKCGKCALSRVSSKWSTPTENCLQPTLEVLESDPL